MPTRRRIQVLIAMALLLGMLSLSLNYGQRSNAIGINRDAVAKALLRACVNAGEVYDYPSSYYCHLALYIAACAGSTAAIFTARNASAAGSLATADIVAFNAPFLRPLALYDSGTAYLCLALGDVAMHNHIAETTQESKQA
ncbi:hypothetical protein V1511DRAFT_490434 [Dipodascopsis uninucleata]